MYCIDIDTRKQLHLYIKHINYSILLKFESKITFLDHYNCKKVKWEFWQCTVGVNISPRPYNQFYNNKFYQENDTIIWMYKK